MVFVAFRDTGYMVSDQGVVMNPNGMILKGVAEGKGYMRVSINDKRYLVHRLVAECFIPNPNGLELVCHKDGDKSNNSANNLEWRDRSSHQKHINAIGLRRATKSWDNPKSKAVAMYSLSGDLQGMFGSLSDATDFLNKPHWRGTHIAMCCNGERKSAFKHKWEWLSELQGKIVELIWRMYA